jgi:glycosyltransferase involved in cell wall biosynthesis
LPIVATDVPGCRDVVTSGVNGLLVPVKNPQALADALETLILDRELRLRMGAAARHIAIQFNTKKVNAETLMVYRTFPVFQKE